VQGRQASNEFSRRNFESIRVNRYRPDKLLIDMEVAESPFTRGVLESLSGVPVEYVSNVRALVESANHQANALTQAKRQLLVTANKGQFLKKCPGSRDSVCCNYYVIDWASNCNMECSYCILQTLLNNPLMVCYANTGDMFAEIDYVVDRNPTGFYRIGTGEWTDSMALDHLTKFSTMIIPHFAKKKNAILEIKTKTDNIENLLDLNHRGKTVISWSLNAESITEGEEHKTARYLERLDAARRCIEAGYKVGFHFDPMIRHEGWRENYRRAVAGIFDRIPSRQVAWISMGTLRFAPDLKRVIQKRFPRSGILYEEFVRGEDGKMHYFRPLRVELYRNLVDAVAECDKGTKVFLCMETAEVWNEVFGSAPACTSKLAEYLDSAVRTG
jgi:spore photoproduct lyase